MRACTHPGCAAPHRARDLCSTHYSQRYQPNRHRKTTVPCTWCGRACAKATTSRYANRFCSLDCRDTWRRRDRLPVLFVGTVNRPEPVRPSPPPSTKRWVAGNCVLCGSPYVAEDYTNTARYCSAACLKRADRDRYRARKRDAYVADVWRGRVYRRDGWRCRLCRKKVRRDKAVPHPLAPVLDHIVPLACGGTHEPANTQCAHYLCNSLKRDTFGAGQQLLLFG